MLYSTTEPIHSRGIGRSGPKRKTGCLTCRRRKVRCDEARPACANCVRLRLDCAFVEPTRKTKVLQSSPIASLGTPENTTSRRSFSETSQASSIDQQQIVPYRDHPDLQVNAGSYPNTDEAQAWNIANVSGPTFTSPFQDIFLSSLDNFDVGIDFAASDDFLGTDLLTPHALSVTPAPSPTAGAALINDERRRDLLEHFIQSTNPISVILPTHTEWSSACRGLLAMARECLCVSSAICAFSALHLFTTKGDMSLDEAFQCYSISSDEVDSILDNANVEDRKLKQAFATIFLLLQVELMAQTSSKAKRKDWPLRHLQSAHLRVKQHLDRIRSWTGISKRLLTWVTLLQTKAEYNSGFTALEHCSTPLSKSIGDPFARNPDDVSNGTDHEDVPVAGRSENSYDDMEDDTRTVAELAYDTINQPTFDFFLKSQAFISRIIGLDRYHRRRGTLEIEFETLKDGQQISNDLHSLWTTRPATTAFLSNPEGLEEVLQPKLARRVLLNLRVYVANYYALFIYLHRVAYKTYPATADVSSAVSNIMSLSRDIVGGAPGPRGRRTSSTTFEAPPHQERRYSMHPPRTLQDSESSIDSGLPATMLWPLFLAALESGVPERFWLLQTMKEMDNQQVPNAAKTVFLLEEVLRRQDKEGQRVDHRSVRLDLFEGELSVLY